MTMKRAALWFMPALMLWLVCTASAATTPVNPARRVVSLGGSVTEIVYALGQQDRLAGNDLSSIYPADARNLPHVGYYRNLPIEGLLSLQPDLILASEQAGPETTLKRIESLGIPVRMISDRPDLDSLYERIRQVAQALDQPQAGQALEQHVRDDIERHIANDRHAGQTPSSVRTVFVMKHTSQLMGAGTDTTPATLLQLAGLENGLATHRGYKPISAEALATLQPDLIITTEASVKALGGIAEFVAAAGIAMTPAARRGHVLVMDDLLILGLGPRTGMAVQQLIDARNASTGTS